MLPGQLSEIYSVFLHHYHHPVGVEEARVRVKILLMLAGPTWGLVTVVAGVFVHGLIFDGAYKASTAWRFGAAQPIEIISRT